MERKRRMMHPDAAVGAATSRGGWVRRAVLVAAAVAASCVVALQSGGIASATGVFSTTAAVNVRSGPGTNAAVIGGEPAGATFTLRCQWQGGTNIGGNATWDSVQFGNGVVGAITDYLTTTPSWNNYAPGTLPCLPATPGPPAPSPAVTPQMQNAANWAVGEKNSPDPTWSDYFHRPWSGLCEAFVQQAEGFRFQFGSALADYYWQKNNGRIHLDPYPPVGALVFYAGGAYGHVAVSIGGGQEVGTYGFDGQRLPVRQYPVTGYLTNRYLGWSRPIGS
ncbi:hypothetical protein SAMN04515671_2241 [Nakamurella panacisegetis]|uniref:SH3b domain-containing protein n=1 Tax=Nakamurella panacisegetis TaxID=1090615 RepID=A0A1H0N7G7_9ACTN|nr:hypothetical protein [Nakamurella panacisegetis]SDO88644.1 hypothetical protein SAMN04515671_2241 [Nakamurella panacisegetis]